MFRSTLVATTFALSMADPAGSLISPEIVARNSCAKLLARNSSSRQQAENKVDFIQPPDFLARERWAWRGVGPTRRANALTLKVWQKLAFLPVSALIVGFI